MGRDAEDIFGTPAAIESPIARTATPIATMLEGVVFRSRLEARWAEFFRSLDVRALYEHEAFEFDDGTRYLPDFWLPKLETFVEIKPTKPTADEMRKCRLLATSTQRRVLLLIGSPGDWLREDAGAGEYGLRFFSDGAEDSPYLPCECRGCGAIDWQFDGRADRIKCGCKKSAHGDKGHNSASDRIVRAAELANALNLGVR